MKLKLLPKLLVGFGSVALLGAIIGLTGILCLGSLAAADRILNESAVLGLARSTDMMAHFQQVRVGLLKLLLATDSETSWAAVTALGQAKSEAKEALVAYEKTVIDENDRKLATQFEEALNQYLDFSDRVVVKLEADNRAEAVADTFSTAPDGGVTLSNTAYETLSQVVAYNIETGARLAGANAALASGATLTMVVVTVLGLGLAVILALWFGVILVSRPIQANVTLLGRLAAGDLTARGNPQSLARADEIGLLTRAADKLTQDLKGALGQISGSAQQLHASSETMGQRMEATIHVVEGVSRGIGEVNDHVINQSASVAETAATSQQILRNLDGLNQLIAEQAANVTESSASIEEMIAGTDSVIKSVDKMTVSFDQLQAASDDGKIKIQKVVETIAHVAHQSVKLQEANNVIKSIASQTSLLSMNAAIEAAHAGDAGRGFAVVADEIRKLAEVSTLQSKEISTNIRSIEAYIQAGAQDSTVASQSFHAIVEQITRLVEYNNQIQSAMEEQGVGSKQILEALGQINSITSRVRDGSGEMLEGSRNINDEMQKLLAVTERLQAKTNELNADAETIREAVALAQTTSQDTLKLASGVSAQVGRFTLG